MQPGQFDQSSCIVKGCAEQCQRDPVLVRDATGKFQGVKDGSDRFQRSTDIGGVGLNGLVSHGGTFENMGQFTG
jgi:hypothetical protein